MATVATFTIEADEFALGATFEGLSGVRIELERVVPTDETVVPYLWLRGVDADDVDGLPDRSPILEDVELVCEVDGKYLVKPTWEWDYDGALRAIAETDVTLLSAEGTEERWTFEIRGDSRDAVSRFQRRCHDLGVSIVLQALYSLPETRIAKSYGLTDAQREALVLAYSRGYFGSPREATLAEMAGELGITGQSMGSRLRRGIHRLIGNTLVGSTDG